MEHFDFLLLFLFTLFSFLLFFFLSLRFLTIVIYVIQRDCVLVRSLGGSVIFPLDRATKGIRKGIAFERYISLGVDGQTGRKINKDKIDCELKRG